MAIKTGKIYCDFIFKYLRFTWRERYYAPAVATLPAALAQAKLLVPYRLAMCGSGVNVEDGPILDRVIATQDSIFGDSDEDTTFRGLTAGLGFGFGDIRPADPRFVIVWRTNTTSGFGRTRELGGIPAYLLGVPDPGSDPQFQPLFTKFSAALKGGGWGFAATGARPGGPVQNKISFIEASVESGQARVWSSVLPAPNQDVEIVYARFSALSSKIRGVFTVRGVGNGFFVIDFLGSDVLDYVSGGIWRFPSATVQLFDDSAAIEGVGTRKRGFKTYSNKGRTKSRPRIIF